MRRRALLLAIALATAAPAVEAQSRPALDVILPVAAALGEEGPMVRVRNALSERYVTDLLRNGFPARLNFRAELWTTGGFFNARQRSVEWDILVRYDALRREYEVVRVERDSAVARTRFAQFAEVEAEIERPVRAPILPLPKGDDKLLPLATGAAELKGNDVLVTEPVYYPKALKPGVSVKAVSPVHPGDLGLFGMYGLCRFHRTIYWSFDLLQVITIIQVATTLASIPTGGFSLSI